MLILASLLTGCTPHDAEVQADYAMFFADDTSDALSLLRQEKKFEKQSDLKPVDCRTLESEDERLEGADPACADEDPVWFSWLSQYQYWVKEGSVTTEDDIWRTEAVLTSEGDLQLTAHAHVGDFGDFRFGFVIDPAFQPQTCEGDGDAAALTDVDGDWLAGWSANDSGATVWHLNAGAYQINPNNFDDYWFFDNSWEAGASFARFGEEVIYHQGVSYSQYGGETLDGPLYYPAVKGGLYQTALPDAGADIDAWATDIQSYLTENDDFARLAGTTKLTPKYRVHSNSWRPTDELEQGLDNWVEVSLGYVKIDNFTPGDTIEAGEQAKPLTGEFQVFLTATDTPSRLMVNGTFTINNITQIENYNPPLDQIKREENGTPACQ